jgi:hypothetical protein
MTTTTTQNDELQYKFNLDIPCNGAHLTESNDWSREAAIRLALLSAALLTYSAQARF